MGTIWRLKSGWIWNSKVTPLNLGSSFSMPLRGFSCFRGLLWSKAEVALDVSRLEYCVLLGFLAILRWSDIPMTISSQHDPRTSVAGEGEPGSPFSFSWRKGSAVLTEFWHAGHRDLGDKKR